MTRFDHQLLAIAQRGYEARLRGEPDVCAKYQQRDNLSRQRREHWHGGWREADELIKFKDRHAQPK